MCRIAFKRNIVILNFWIVWIFGIFVPLQDTFGQQVTNFTDDAILKFIGMTPQDETRIDGLAYAAGVCASPDWRFLYVAGRSDGAISVFVRDSVTGHLSFVHHVRDKVGGVTGLAWPEAVTINGDGRFLYATDGAAKTIAVFQRNVDTGRLTHVMTASDPDSHESNRPHSFFVEISPDDRILYTGSQWDGELTIWQRNVVDGSLTLAYKHANIPELSGIRSMDIPPDGRHAYIACPDFNGIASGEGNKVLVCERDSLSGNLNIIQTIDNIREPYHIRSSPDGHHLYVAGYRESGVLVYRRDMMSGLLQFQEAHLDTDPVDCL